MLGAREDGGKDFVKRMHEFPLDCIAGSHKWGIKMEDGDTRRIREG